MKAFAGLLAALALAGCASALRAEQPTEGLADYGYRAEDDAILTNGAEALGFTGHLAVSRRPGSIHLYAMRDPSLPNNSDLWPWASVTKQAVATMVLQQVEMGRIELDSPASDYLPALGQQPASPTVRQLLRHQSGLRNPAQTAAVDGFPAFYAAEPDRLGWCLGSRQAVSTVGGVSNDCDYIALAAILETASGQSLGALFKDRIAVPAGLADTHFLPEGDSVFMGSDAAFRAILPRYGAAASLVGTLEEMVMFDRALLDGTLLSSPARNQAWAGDPDLGFMGLGQLSFSSLLTGCEASVRIVEGRGQIGKYQIRNFILPESDLVLAVATEDAALEFGEVWTGKGLSYELLGLALCGAQP